MLENNWAMHHHHHWSMDELDEMIPWEFQVYEHFTREHIKKLEEAKRAR